MLIVCFCVFCIMFQRLVHFMKQVNYNFEINTIVFDNLINPYAFIRVKDEDLTFQHMLDSIYPVISRGVIVYMNSTDRTEEIVHSWCKKHSSFQSVRYNEAVIRSDTAPEKNRLFTFYNYALSFIPKNEWLIKLDADQIYDSHMLRVALSKAKHTNQLICFPRMTIVCYNKTGYFPKWETYIRNPCDQWIVYNKGLHFRMGVPWKKSSCEWLTYETNRNIIRTDFLFIYHFPFVKRSRRNIKNIEQIILPLKFDNLKPLGYKCQQEFCNVSRIHKFCSLFQ